MVGVHVGDFESPDEVRTPDKTKVDVGAHGRCDHGGAVYLAARLALVGMHQTGGGHRQLPSAACRVSIQSGRMQVVHDDGTEMAIEPGK